jgi:hypothetical protein
LFCPAAASVQEALANALSVLIGELCEYKRLDPTSMLVSEYQSDLPGLASNNNKDRNQVYGGLGGHERFDRKADATDSALHGFHIWGYCVAHFYHEERPHQGLQNRLIQPGAEANRSQGEVECRNRLGGMLRYYHREAA